MKKIVLALFVVATLVACNQVTEKKCGREFKDIVQTDIDSVKVDSTLVVKDTIFKPEILKK